MKIKKWLKIVLGLVGLIVLALILLYTIFLKDDYIKEPKLEGQLISDSLTINNTTRHFQWYQPKSLKKITTVLFVIHGSKSDGATIRKQTSYEFDKLADEKGFIVVYPTGFFNHWNDCRASADYKANVDNIDDISFLKEIEQNISKKLGTPFNYRFATGHSNGGQFCYKLALEAPDWIDGIAPMSANLPIDDNLDCNKSETFVPVVLINGSDDKFNPYDGGLVEIFGNVSRGTVLSTEETIKYWTNLKGYKNSPNIITLPDTDTNDKSTVEQYTWEVEEKSEVILYKVVGGGHTIPHPKGSYPRILGNTNHDVNASELIWNFFENIREQN